MNKKRKKLVFDTIRNSAIDECVVNASRFAKPLARQNLNYRAEVLSLFPELSKGQRVLDVGVAWGQYLFPLAELNKLKGVELYGLEHPKLDTFTSKKLFMDKLKEYAIHLIRTDIVEQKLPFKDDFFDVIFFGEIIEHIHPSKLSFVLNELNRVLKKNAILIVTTPNLLSFVHRIRFLFGSDFDWDINSNPIYGGTYGHVREYSEKELKMVFKEKGFKTLKIKFFNISYGLPALDIVNNSIGFFFKNFRNNIVMVFKK